MNGTKTDLQEQSDDLAYFAKAIEHFETHDIGDELANSPEVNFEVNPQIRRRRYPLDSHLAAQLDSIAQQRGVAAEALLDEWVREKMAETPAGGAAR